MSDEPNKLAEEASVGPATQSAQEAQAAPPADVEQPVVPEGQEQEDVAEAEIVEAEAAKSEVPEETREGDSTEPVEAESAETESAETEAEEPELEEAESEPVDVEQPAVQPEAESAESTDDASTEMDWYILKVQSNRERSISEALRRKVAIEGLDEFFGEIVVPTEKVTEFKGGKKKVVERKLYPGYIVVHMHINDDTWFAVRETSGIGDFTGSGGKPTPMLPHEVARIIQTEEEETTESPKLNISFNLEDKVKIKEGTFESFEGEVSTIDAQSGRITVMINIFGRSTPVELEHWQVEQI